MKQLFTYCAALLFIGLSVVPSPARAQSCAITGACTALEQSLMPALQAHEVTLQTGRETLKEILSFVRQVITGPDALKTSSTGGGAENFAANTGSGVATKVAGNQLYALNTADQVSSSSPYDVLKRIRERNQVQQNKINDDVGGQREEGDSGGGGGGSRPPSTPVNYGNCEPKGICGPESTCKTCTNPKSMCYTYALFGHMPKDPKTGYRPPPSMYGCEQCTQGRQPGNNLRKCGNFSELKDLCRKECDPKWEHGWEPPGYEPPPPKPPGSQVPTIPGSGAGGSGSNNGAMQQLGMFLQVAGGVIGMSTAQDTATQKAATEADARMTDFKIQQDRETAQLMREGDIAVQHRPLVEQCIAMGASRNMQMLNTITNAQIRLSSQNFTKDVVQNSKLAGAAASSTVQIVNIASKFADPDYHNRDGAKFVPEDAPAARDSQYINADINFERFFLYNYNIDLAEDQQAAEAMMSYLKLPHYNEPKVDERQKMGDFRQAEFFRSVANAAFNREHSARLINKDGPSTGVWLRDWLRELGYNNKDVNEVPDKISKAAFEAFMFERIMPDSNYLASFSGNDKQTQMLQVMEQQLDWETNKTLRLLTMVSSAQLYLMNQEYRRDKGVGGR